MAHGSMDDGWMGGGVEDGEVAGRWELGGSNSEAGRMCDVVMVHRVSSVESRVLGEQATDRRQAQATGGRRAMDLLALGLSGVLT